MNSYQTLLFDWVACQSAVTGAVILAAGLVAGLQGFRFARALIAVCAAGLGYLGASAIDYPVPGAPMFAGLLGAVAAGAVSLAAPRPAFVATNGVVWALLAAYLAGHVGLRGYGVISAGGVLGAAGIVLALVSHRTMVVLLTSLVGAAAIIVGLVGLAQGFAPVISSTFRGWARSQSPVIPVFLAIITTTIYSYQANAKQGNLFTGGQSDARPAR